MNRQAKTIIQKAYTKFIDDGPIRLAATLSFIAIFAFAPIVVIVLSLIGFITDQDIASLKLFVTLNDFIGVKATELIREIVANYSFDPMNLPKTLLSGFIFIVATTTFFSIIQNSLNYIWRVKTRNRDILQTIRDRMLTILMIVGLSILFLFTLLVEAYAMLLKSYLESTLPDFAYIILKLTKILFSTSIFILCFAAFFKFLPDVLIKWKVVWMGAIITGILFSIGKIIISFGLSHVQLASIYGAAGSLIVFLLWVFYSAIIFYFGAEITHQYAEVNDKQIVPKHYAVKFKIVECDTDKH